MGKTNYLTTELVSHTRRVCSLYKKMWRDVNYWEDDFFECRIKRLQLRASFDKNKNIADMREAKALLIKTEEKFKWEQQHPAHFHGQPWHPFSKEGIAYERNLLSPDWVMDYHHPLYKAQYPYYFAKREEMKDEYLKLWTKKMTKPGVKQVGGGH